MINKAWTAIFGAGAGAFVAVAVMMFNQIEKTDTHTDVLNAQFDEAWNEQAARFEKDASAMSGRKADTAYIQAAKARADEARDRQAAAREKLAKAEKHAQNDLDELRSLRNELEAERKQAGVGPNRNPAAAPDPDPLADLWEK